MNSPAFRFPWTVHPPVSWLLGLGALLLAGVSALPYAGGWNDGSRLATVESLVDRHTLAIDESVFCRPSEDATARGYPPYAPREYDLLTSGTRDKLLIGGHFYSDKPAVISLLMAGLYQGAQWLGLPSAAERPDLFCRVVTLGTSGLAYLIAVLALYRLGRLLGLPGRTNLAWVASFALATFALTYTQHVNNHILLLGVVALICLQFARLARETETGQPSMWRLAGLGTLAGVGFNLDLGSGPLLVAGMFGLVLYRCRSRKDEGGRMKDEKEPSFLSSFILHPSSLSKAGLVFALAALPWVAGCLGINYAIGGVWKPMNMVPEYSAWPGCPFNPQNMTGYSRHSPLKLVVYALALLFGKQGFFCHNLPLLLAIPALSGLFRRPHTRQLAKPVWQKGVRSCEVRGAGSPGLTWPGTSSAQRSGHTEGYRPANPCLADPFMAHRPELTMALGWCAATWLLYAVLSNNYGGACCSVRWFVPFLTPGYYLLGVYLRKNPCSRAEFLGLSFWGGVLAVFMWWRGPWTLHVIPVLWPIVGAALLTWMVCHRRSRRAETEAATFPPKASGPPLAA
jgi:hypothetical protein